ncbi:MAG: hypothetical protein QOJ48_1360, partial [Frankiales bacterium]|nr:hypothetical protein [Frankiales bacterium]
KLVTTTGYDHVTVSTNAVSCSQTQPLTTHTQLIQCSETQK